MTNDPLTQFRSDVPLPDEATTQRIYARATTGRRHVVTRRRLVLAAAVLAAAGIAGGLSVTLGGGGRNATLGGNGSSSANGPNRPGGFMPLMPLSLTFNRDGQTLTSIDATVNNTRYPNATLALEVQHSDTSGANIQSVFDETVAMTSTGSTGQDATVSTWSGTLSPSDWTGGCSQDGIYRIRTAVYAAGTSVADPFNSGDADGYDSVWFTCSGAGAQGPSGAWAPGTTGANGPTGATGPTGG